MIEFLLHREVKGNEYLALYEILKLPVTKSRIGFFEIPIVELHEPFAERWYSEVVDSYEDAFWDTDRVNEEMARLQQIDWLEAKQAAVLRQTLGSLLPILEQPSCWVHVHR